jgi:hypothetical protein
MMEASLPCNFVTGVSDGLLALLEGGFLGIWRHRLRCLIPQTLATRVSHDERLICVVDLFLNGFGAEDAI